MQGLGKSEGGRLSIFERWGKKIVHPNNFMRLDEENRSVQVEQAPFEFEVEMNSSNLLALFHE
jgi:hypothetical protein